MKFDKFRRSDNVEDFRDPDKPVVMSPDTAAYPITINDALKLTGSDLAKEAGAGDITKRKAG